MEIINYKKVEYRGCPIYLRRIGTMFEYFVIIRNELYSYYIEVNPERYMKFLHFVGVAKDLYTTKQKNANLIFVQKMAESVVDTIKDGTGKRKSEKNSGTSGKKRPVAPDDEKKVRGDIDKNPRRALRDNRA